MENGINKDIIDLPVPEMFASANYTIISWLGENYYKACNAFVSDLPDGGQSFCVKRVDHPSISHEDFDGRMRTRTPEDEHG